MEKKKKKKKCTKCSKTKSTDEFYKSPTTKDGFTYWCKGCYAENYANNRERQLASNQKARIKRQYGLSVDEYKALISQGCTICGETEKRVVLDHCHATDSVRGPLCDLCNVMLGAAHDDPMVLRQAIVYLEQHG